MSRFSVAVFLCLVFAPLAHAQSFDCAGATGVLQRVCASPALIALEEERRQLVADVQFFDPAHPAVQAEAVWLVSLEGCADDACLAAAYGAHNQTLRAALEAARPIEEPAPAPAPEPAPAAERPRAPASTPLDAGPAVQPQEFLPGVATVLVVFLIALWLWRLAARARRRDRGD